ncbi:hypothetical protein CEXT_231971 [Caerostris extrusa]|uniref:Uncharacterized protein n=1 Tax=Caerostris extrusa TaxID=172846 RepID=A0AAV4SQ87_CAEEX|nr:hypothetical protein CEXT_231971 [Caerostris extrusa]
MSDECLIASGRNPNKGRRGHSRFSVSDTLSARSALTATGDKTNEKIKTNEIDKTNERTHVWVVHALAWKNFRTITGTFSHLFHLHMTSHLTIDLNRSQKPKWSRTKNSLKQHPTTIVLQWKLVNSGERNVLYAHLWNSLIKV